MIPTPETGVRTGAQVGAMSDPTPERCDHAKGIHLRPIVLAKSQNYQHAFMKEVSMRCYACGKRWTEDT